MTQPHAGKESQAGEIRKRIALGFGPLVLLALLLAALVWNTVATSAQRRSADKLYVHALEVLLTSQELRAAVHGTLRGERGYLLTGEEQFLDPYRVARRNVRALAARMERATSDNPTQRRNSEELVALVPPYLDYLTQAIALRREGRSEEAFERVRNGAGEQRAQSLLAVIDRMEVEERRLLALRADRRAAATRALDRSYIGFGILGLVLLATSSWAGLATLHAQRRIREMAEHFRLSATTDELTGLANRRAFMEALDIEIARARRTGTALTLAVIDLDHFKRVNDRHGHAGGDAVLRGFAEVARATVRLGDVVGRLGGEEFAILMPGTDKAAANYAANRLRRAIAQHCFTLPDGAEINVTLSTGLAALVPEDDRDRLVRRADEALYRAKADGRDLVRLAA